MDVWTITLLLLFCPPTDDTPSPLPAIASPDLTYALRDTARLLDLWDGETGWHNYAVDVAWCQRHWRRAYDSPPLADAERLPPLESVSAAVDFARAHVAWLEARTDKFADATGQVSEARWLLAWWELALTARRPGQCLAGRRESLGEMRRLIGEQAWCAGEWPVVVPVWRFGR